MDGSFEIRIREFKNNRRLMRALVVGGGSIGTRHLRNLKTLGIAPLAVVEPDTEQRRELNKNVGVTVLESFEAGLDWGPDLVVIATPSHLHVSQALEAAQKGCQLFIEKPLSYNRDSLPELCEKIDHSRLISLVGCNMRFHPGPANVKRLLEERAIGEVIAARIQIGSYLPRWRPYQDYRQSYSASPEWGGAILDCIHEIDLAIWYFGPAKVLAAAHRPARTIGLETDGLAEIILEHQAGILSNVHLNFVQRDYRRAYQIIGSEGTIYWDFEGHQVCVYGPEGELKQVCPEPEGWQVNQMYLDELQHLLWALENDCETVNPVDKCMAVLEIALVAKDMG
jgi:predicted dehydrogenase